MDVLFSSLFGELTKNVQVRFDAISEMNKRLFDNVLIEDFLDWDMPTMSLTFEELIGQYNISVAAPTIGDNSKEAIMGSEGLQTMSEKVLNHAITRPMPIQTYRKILELLDSKSINDKQKTQQLVNTMWGEVKSVVESVYGKLDLLFLRALSNEGIVTLDETTNPEGGVRGQINYNQPADNIASAKTQWTPENIDTVDCFEDIQAIIDASQDKVVLSKILLSPAMLAYICRSKKIKQMLWGSDKASQLVQLRDLNDYMQSNNLPVFQTIRRQVRIQKGQERPPYSPWNDKNLVFIPAGKLGLIKNAFANNEIREDAGVAYSNYGRIRVSQWGKGETDGSNNVEFTKAECLALPVITEMNGIYTLKAKQ